MRRTLLFMATTALVMLVACSAALAASIKCPTDPDGYCYGTNRGDSLSGTSGVDREYGYGGSDLMYGYGGSDFMYGGNETGLGDKMLGGVGADLVNGQGGNDLISGGPGRDTLKTGRGSDRVEAKDGEKDTIICDGSDAVSYDVGLDELQGCTPGLIELPPTDSPFAPDTKVLVEHKEGKELCLPEAALKGHLKHGDEVLDWSGCTEKEK